MLIFYIRFLYEIIALSWWILAWWFFGRLVLFNMIFCNICSYFIFTFIVWSSDFLSFYFMNVVILIIITFTLEPNVTFPLLLVLNLAYHTFSTHYIYLNYSFCFIYFSFHLSCVITVRILFLKKKFMILDFKNVWSDDLRW